MVPYCLVIRIILRFLSIITIFTSGMIANINFEFRFRLTAYYHLLVHAIFKSILAAGAVIHSMKNTQDIRLLENLNDVIPYVIIRLLINNFSNIALRGVPFISGFYRKDIIIEDNIRKREINIFIFILIILSLLLTASYSVRLFYYFFLIED
ncbi:NU5M oxidoreductase, partial [Pseudoatta argentina]